MSASETRLRYGSGKYAALSLMAARWLRLLPPGQGPFNYVTLGGTELRDVTIWHWINSQVLAHVFSFEKDPVRCSLAKETAERIREKGFEVVVKKDDIFEYERNGGALSHIFFIDLEGVCKPRPFINRFRKWLDHGVIGPGDFLLITSYLGRNPGWDKILAPFDSEFRLLRISTFGGKRSIYQMAHPLFILHRALLNAGLNQELCLNCIGYIKYRDTSTMGLYGIAFSEGQTRLETLVRGFPAFDMTRGDWAHGFCVWTDYSKNSIVYA